jgi:hypothetical protein
VRDVRRASRVALGFAQHPDDDRSSEAVLPEVDQELGELTAHRRRPELPDPRCALESGSIST